MKTKLAADMLPLLIGSLPLTDHVEAVRRVFETTPDIPLWVQLPACPREGMMTQFLSGFPGLTFSVDKTFIATDAPDFEAEMVKFYEEYLLVSGGEKDLLDSRFALETDAAAGFFAFTDRLRAGAAPKVAVKGQITGPFTICTGTRERNGRAIFYNAELKDAAITLLALRAAWQVRVLSAFKEPVIIFLDEPALAGYGSSAFIGITREEVASGLEQLISAIHSEGGLAGVHVCANTDWSLILESQADIVNFDAYSFFDRFILYKEPLREFIESGRILAWGIIPTQRPEDIERETAASLAALWRDQAATVTSLGIDPGRLRAQSLITPSCGTGSLSPGHAMRVLRLTRELSDLLREGEGKGPDCLSARCRT
jgi:methionine synthase II (cobalamin-independent)